MMDLLTNLRTWTPDRNADGRSDFDDLPRGHFKAAKVTGMVRIVEGADDLVHTGPRNQTPGMVKIPTTDELSGGVVHVDGRCDNPRCCPVDGPADLRTEGQVRYMDNLIDWITEKDEEAGAAARTWTDNVTAAGKWEIGRDNPSKFSISGWINRLKDKNNALNTTAKLAPKPVVSADDIPNGYYALADAGPDDIHFFRVSRYRSGDIKVQERAADTLHPVYGGRAKAVLDTIRKVGSREARELYGRTIGRCGRCNITLTDKLSRARGIGPDCWEKM